MRSFLVPTPRGPIAGLETGAGPPLVLVAGLGSTARVWGELPILLGDRFTVVAPDNRGVGGSRKGAPFTLEGAAKDLLAVVDARCPARPVLLGASLGGAIAMEAAIRAPERIAGLIVVSAAARLRVHGRRMLELLRDLLLYLPPELVGRALMTLAFAPAFHERHAAFVDGVTSLYGLAEEDAPGALAQVEHLLEGWDLRPRLGELRLPTLVVAGGRDPVVAPEDTEELASTIPGAELVRLEHVAHSALAEAGPTLLERLREFCALALANEQQE